MNVLEVVIDDIILNKSIKVMGKAIPIGGCLQNLRRL